MIIRKVTEILATNCSNGYEFIFYEDISRKPTRRIAMAGGDVASNQSKLPMPPRLCVNLSRSHLALHNSLRILIFAHLTQTG
jgi:hypothetical protein